MIAYSEEEIEAEVKRIVAEIASIDVTKIDSNVRLKALGLDSMMALEIMSGVERRFDLRIQEEDLLKMVSVAAAVKLIAGYISKAN